MKCRKVFWSVLSSLRGTSDKPCELEKSKQICGVMKSGRFSFFLACYTGMAIIDQMKPSAGLWISSSARFSYFFYFYPKLHMCILVLSELGFCRVLVFAEGTVEKLQARYFMVQLALLVTSRCISHDRSLVMWKGRDICVCELIISKCHTVYI